MGAGFSGASRHKYQKRMGVSLSKLSLMGLPRSRLEELSNGRCPFVAEGFADRRYRPDGSLVPRSEPDAFVADPHEAVHRFRAAQDRRSHLESVIHSARCDLDCQTEERGRPYTLVCTKNTASYQARLAKYHQDQEHLATIRSIEANVPE